MMEETELPAGESGINLPKRRVLIVIGALVLGMFLGALDQTVVSTALPRITSDLGGSSRLAWVITAYLLSSTISTPLWGKLGDQYGRKKFFQLSIVIFVVGSAFSGQSHSMTELIIFRFLQGLGGGGLMVGAQTILGDVVSPRERGRYMGLFMAMFGVTTVIGPLIGGLFVQHLTWRWIFYINLPVGILALIVTSIALPGAHTRVHRVIDYLGAALLSGGAAGLVLFTSLGGASFPWGSPVVIICGVVGVLMTLLFLVVELRAREPVMPLRLFRNRAFNSASSIGFVTGFLMFGGLTFLPLYLQVVRGVTPTDSGIRLFPMMLGLMVMSIGSGQIVSRWGRYKIFPVVGTALLSVGLFLMSKIGVHTGTWTMSAYMLCFGAGMGLVLSVIVVAVQNSVPYEELGVATSNTTFFRMIGGSFGTAVFGSVFSNLIVGNVRKALPGVPIPRTAVNHIDTLSQFSHLPGFVKQGIESGLSHTVDTVFLVGVPIGVLAFLASLILPEIPLRRSIRTVEPVEGFVAPEGRTSLEEMRLALERMTSRENRVELYQNLATRAGLDLPPAACWLLYRLAERPEASLESVAEQLQVSPDRIESGAAALRSAGLITTSATVETTRGGVHLTPKGDAAVEKLAEARRAELTELLEGWDLESNPEVITMVRELASVLLADDERILADTGIGIGSAGSQPPDPVVSH